MIFLLKKTLIITILHLPFTKSYTPPQISKQALLNRFSSSRSGATNLEQRIDDLINARFDEYLFSLDEKFKKFAEDFSYQKQNDELDSDRDRECDCPESSESASNSNNISPNRISKIEKKLEYPAKALPIQSFVRSLFYEFHRTSVEFEWPLSVPFRGFSWVPFRGFSWVFVGFRGFSWDVVGFRGILPVSFVGFPGLSKVPF